MRTLLRFCPLVAAGLAVGLWPAFVMAGGGGGGGGVQAVTVPGPGLWVWVGAQAAVVAWALLRRRG